MPKSESVTILDNTVLSNFAAIRRLDLLTAAFPEGHITTEIVFRELLDGVRAGVLPDLSDEIIPVVEFEDAEKALITEPHGLDPGEWSCLVVALQRGYAIATDDWAARREADRRNIPKTGTLGALVSLVRSDVLSLEDANRMLQGMVAAGYRSPIDRLDDLI